jgi:hypothetical protein
MKKKRGLVIKIGSFLVSFLLLSFAFANDVKVETNIDRDRVPLGELFVVRVIVQTEGSGNNVEEPQLPNLDGMQLMQRGKNVSVQSQLVSTPQGMDYKNIRREIFAYTFQAIRLGRLSLDAIEVVVNGKLYQTRPLLVEVLPESEFPAADPNDIEEQILQEQEDIFEQLLRRHMIPRGQVFPGPTQNNRSRTQKEPEFRSMPTNPNEAFFIQLEADKTSVYEGEQITATWYLVTRGQMESLDRAKFPSLKGFWKEIIEENPQIQFYDEVINGVVYRKALMATHALFPIKSGKAIIDEFTVKSRIRMPTTGFGLGFGRAYEFTKSSKRLEIQVKALPLDNRPKEFTGAVGKFDVNSRVEGSQNFYVNQPISVKVRFEGSGNAKIIELPLIAWSDGLELYDTKSESRFFKDGKSYKEFEILVIPRKEGALEVPEIQFAFFNPETEKYELKKTAAIPLDVKPALQNQSEGSGSFLGSKTSKSVPIVMAMPKLQKLDQSSVRSSQAGSLFWLGLYIVSLLGLLARAYHELKPKNKTVTLKKEIEIRFSKIQNLIKAENYRQVGAEIVNVSNFVLAEVTSHKGEILEIQKMIDQLPPELRDKRASELMRVYEQAQVYGFAPDEVFKNLASNDGIQKLVRSAQKVLEEICQNWKPKD